ncbi:MAG TPA: DUF1549 domain-containing protein [Planctomycetota bacterium]|nr:DUF1549 domain-containing protein [Planctomycetota bacterium]
MQRHLRLSFFCLFALALSVSISGAEADAEQTKFFEMKIRPLLINHCFDCHGEKKHKGALRLDSIGAILKGGQTGPAIVPGHPEKSLLITAVSYTDAELEMPPKEKLSPAEVDALTQWVKMGAPWPKDDSQQIVMRKQKPITDKDRAWWSFQPLKVVSPPAVDNTAWTKNPIDAFIFSKLKEEGLSPAPEADKAALIRRLTFDLHGLPPTPEEIEAFVSDTSSDAYEKLVDRLLSSPRYGERWARHWLDLVRYAESDGFRQDAFRPTAWAYRDYVIKAFNEDKPYDRFLMEQLAGDEIDPENPDVLVATGYLRLGPYEYNQRDVPKQWSEILNDVTDVTGDVFLGLSMGCARCHDHKFDPILQEDYFKLQAFFNGLRWRDDLPLATPEVKAAHAAKLKVWEEKTAAIREKIAALEAPFVQKGIKTAIEKFVPEIQAPLNKPASERSTYETQIAELAYRQILFETERTDSKMKGKDKEAWTALQRQLGEFDDIRPKPLMKALAATDVSATPATTVIPGDKRNTDIKPGFLKVLGEQPLELKALPNSTGRRTALAKWLARGDNPLTTRVIANRIWQYHFGRGLVATSSDYGTLGEKPSHPELLDFLADRFVKDGWSFKKMHKLMLTSNTYKQTALRKTPDVAKLKDPENRWLWRMNTRRLDAEQIRDAMLAVSGELKLDAGGPSVEPSQPRRTIYTKLFRNVKDGLLDVFDIPDGSGSTPSRNVTTTPTQSLLMINGAWPLQRAEAFAARLQKLKAIDPEAFVSEAYRLAFGVTPTSEQKQAALAFLSKTPAPPPAEVASATGSLVKTGLDVQTMPHLGTRAVFVHNGALEDQLRVADSPALPSEDFTVEAIVQLSSIYENANVRVIAAQWSGNQAHPGWSFGVTSEKSKYQPRNLILQLVGNAQGAQGGPPQLTYEVIPSDLRVELYKVYYLGVSVKIADTSEAGITFFLRDLSDPDATLRTANVKHKVTGGYHSKIPLSIGGRDNHGWDGLIDEVRISKTALNKEQVLIGSQDVPKAAIAGHWQFEETPGLLRDTAAIHAELARAAQPKTPVEKLEEKPGAPTNPRARIDFCHILLNANAFLYVD